MSQGNEKEGYHPFQDEDGNEHGSFEVFLIEKYDGSYEPGWYWQACFPGCLPDTDMPAGPFRTSTEAYQDAQQG